MNAHLAPESTIADRAHQMVRRIGRTFSLRRDTDFDGTLHQVRSDVEFRSGNTWALVCAIVIASIGLNVNSTAVIIGAMLISPLMGPIVGSGFALATNDLALLQRGVRNLFAAMVIGLVSSTAYFLVSPLQGAQSELLARTRPTLYDVLIALFGGIAGAVAVSRKANKSQMVPGVAIATALMPPLCTSGFGLANGDVWIFLGAFHLFLINALFICLATLGLARLMGFDRQAGAVAAVRPPGSTLFAHRVVVGLAIVIGVPSLYTGWQVVQEARFQKVVRRFVAENLNFPDRALVNLDVKYGARGSTIRATVLGEPIDDEVVRELQGRLPAYGLSKASLVLSQPAKGQASAEQIGQMVRQGILDDLNRRNEEIALAREARIRTLEADIQRLHAAEIPVRDILNEVVALFPALVSLGAGTEASLRSAPDAAPNLVVVASWRSLPGTAEQQRLQEFLRRRLTAPTLRVVNVRAR